MCASLLSYRSRSISQPATLLMNGYSEKSISSCSLLVLLPELVAGLGRVSPSKDCFSLSSPSNNNTSSYWHNKLSKRHCQQYHRYQNSFSWLQASDVAAAADCKYHRKLVSNQPCNTSKYSASHHSTQSHKRH